MTLAGELTKSNEVHGGFYPIVTLDVDRLFRHYAGLGRPTCRKDDSCSGRVLVQAR